MASPATTTLAIQTLSIATSLLASGAIASLTLFDIPELQSQPASRSLPSIRWLFSRGSHIMPQAAFASSAGFAYLAYSALPSSHRTLTLLIRLAANGSKTNGYLIAAALAMSIGPFTSLMIPTNFTLIKMNEDLGGARSAKSARKGTAHPGDRNAEDSVNGKGDMNEFTDLSGPQTKTIQESSTEDDQKVQQLLGKFGAMNAVRGLLIGVGGVVGLWAALM